MSDYIKYEIFSPHIITTTVYYVDYVTCNINWFSRPILFTSGHFLHINQQGYKWKHSKMHFTWFDLNNNNKISLKNLIKCHEYVLHVGSIYVGLVWLFKRKKAKIIKYTKAEKIHTNISYIHRYTVVEYNF